METEAATLEETTYPYLAFLIKFEDLCQSYGYTRIKDEVSDDTTTANTCQISDPGSLDTVSIEAGAGTESTPFDTLTPLTLSGAPCSDSVGDTVPKIVP